MAEKLPRETNTSPSVAPFSTLSLLSSKSLGLSLWPSPPPEDCDHSRVGFKQSAWFQISASGHWRNSDRFNWTPCQMILGWLWSFWNGFYFKVPKSKWSQWQRLCIYETAGSESSWWFCESCQYMHLVGGGCRIQFNWHKKHSRAVSGKAVKMSLCSRLRMNRSKKIFK